VGTPRNRPCRAASPEQRREAGSAGEGSRKGLAREDGAAGAVTGDAFSRTIGIWTSRPPPCQMRYRQPGPVPVRRQAGQAGRRPADPGRRIRPVDLGDIDDSRLQDPGSGLWTYTLTHNEATALIARIKSGDTAAADPLTAPFEKFRDHAPDDPAIGS
jgi:hypothetical protein